MPRNRVGEFIEQGKYDDANMVIGLLANAGVTPTKPKASLLGEHLTLSFNKVVSQIHKTEYLVKHLQLSRKCCQDYAQK